MLKAKKFLLAVLLCFIFAFPVSAIDGISVEARSAMLVDVRSGEVLFEQYADTQIYPASITKIMTALLTVENCELDEVAEVTQHALSTISPDGSSAGLKAGEHMKVETLLYCLLLPSGNDAAAVLAEHIGGSISGFVSMMNSRAIELGCTGTHYANPHGLHDEDHYTTARDTYLVVREFMKHDILTTISNTVTYVVPPTDVVSRERILNTTNYLISSNKTLKYLYSYARGIKTGTTTPAGYCLVSSAEKNGLYLVSILFGAGYDEASQSIMSYVETKRMFEWGFRNFETTVLVDAGEPVTEIGVTMGQETDRVVAVTESAIEHLMPVDFDSDKIVLTPWMYSESVEAPVIKGQYLGEVDVSYEGRSYGRVKLVALSGVDRSNFNYSVDRFTDWAKQPSVWIAVGGVALLIIVYTVTTVAIKRKKRLRRIKKNGRYL